jgi:benzoate/toluate 1,2-dioxygenase beta subunit
VAVRTEARLREVEGFLMEEADLMDDSRYREWEALWDDDAVYWVPARPEEYDPERQVSIIYEDRDAIRVRVERLHSGLAYTQEPRSQVRRVVSNIRVVADEEGMVDVVSNFIALEYRMGRWTDWAGRSEHRLRGQPAGGFRIVRKKVLLVGCDADLPPLQFLL